MNRFPRLSFRAKLGVVVLVPLLAAVVLGLHGTAQRHELGREMSAVRTLTVLSVKVSAVVHQLQKERGRSAGFLGSPVKRFGAELTIQRTATDAAVAELLTFAESSIGRRQHGDSSFLVAWQGAVERLRQLPTVRDGVTNRSLAAQQSFAYYTDAIGVLLDTVTSAATSAHEEKVASAATAYDHFLRLKELTGQERAVLANTFAGDAFAEGTFSRFVTLVGGQAAYERLFATTATADEVDYYRQTVAGPQVDEAARLRAIAMNARQNFGVAPDHWFDTITAKIDLQKEVENRLATDLLVTADEAIVAAEESRNFYAGLTLAVLVVSAGLAARLARSLLRSVRPLIQTAKQVSVDGNYAVRVVKTADDELGMLTDCFNRMLAQIEVNTHEMSNRKETLEREVQARTEELREAQKTLMQTARHAGMAEIANGILHNVGNALNSVNVAAGCAAEHVRNSHVAQMTKVAELVREHRHDFAEFVGEDERGRHLPDYLERLSAALADERLVLLEELEDVTRGVDHIKDIVATQQTYAGNWSVVDSVRPAEIVVDALRMNDSALSLHKITVVRELADLPAVSLDRQKILQILLNLLSNAKQSLDETADHEKKIVVRLESVAGHGLRITVADNGIGMTEEVLARLFTHGFTTKKNGHGFGLHSCAITAKSMGGKLTGRSDGPGRGATFVLELPIIADHAPAEDLESAFTPA
jgi:signal transduction histidine kinase